MLTVFRVIAGLYAGPVEVASVDLLHGDCVTIEPPAIPPGKVARWMGYTDPEPWLLVDVPTPPSPAQDLRIDKSSFWRRFPQENETALRAALIAHPSAIFRASLARWLSRVESSPCVTLDHQETIDGVSWLASHDVPMSYTEGSTILPMRLTPDQVSRILSHGIRVDERFID